MKPFYKTSTAIPHLQRFTLLAITLALNFIYISAINACELVNNENEKVLVFPPKSDSLQPEKDYIFQLLKLVLQKSEDKYGPCIAKLHKYKLPLARIELYLENNHLLNVVALTANTLRDERFRPVPIPISKGLMGYRLFIIRNDAQEKFNNVNSLQDLQNFVAGQGIGWPDVDVLNQNNLPVQEAGSIKTLIDMLVHERFDYFPRGSLQIITELNTYGDKPVQIEKHLVLRYPSLTAFYVNKQNEGLAERLEYGLNKTIDDGSFDQFFFSHPSSIEAVANLDLKNKTVLQICNPILPKWVPINQNKYWLEPWPKDFQNTGCNIKHD
ncbi:hypothetical protein L0668_15845 [Paraglaciecola aquimarina]|uniref:Solute-binding protein family 3/N-terminal domain-containing protein n=1 Tax=Paraglaciecola algarum TaxID=3050085 RepID=A0ABS9DA24_9ALTE|nr:hypothetical protein [Paraglaciecola sp. G1-23]MCF2949594.1 hypothetical protein [Paraglaciecola sp. G1-23]